MHEIESTGSSTAQGSLGTMLFSPKGRHDREEGRVSIDDIGWSHEDHCDCLRPARSADDRRDRSHPRIAPRVA